MATVFLSSFISCLSPFTVPTSATLASYSFICFLACSGLNGLHLLILGPTVISLQIFIRPGPSFHYSLSSCVPTQMRRPPLPLPSHYFLHCSSSGCEMLLFTFSPPNTWRLPERGSVQGCFPPPSTVPGTEWHSVHLHQ